MGIVSGILCLFCFCLLSAKAATAKLHLKRADRLLMKLHKPISACLVILCLVHFVFVMPVLKSRSPFVAGTGAAIIALMILLIYFCHRIKDQTKKMAWHRRLTILMAIGIIGHFTTYILDFSSYQSRVAAIEIDGIDLENVKDGVYRGACDVGYLYAKAEVEIKGGAIVSINLLEHRNERGKRAEDIIDDILSKQNTTVDAITGATNSSNVIKKAVENALNGSGINTVFGGLDH